MIALVVGATLRVVDAALFDRSLDGDIATGPSGPRGRYGGLSHDLKCLRAVLGTSSVQGVKCEQRLPGC